MNEEVLYADGFEKAFIGIGVQFNKSLAIYDYSKCIEVLIDDGMSYEEAVEWMDYNVLGSYVG